MFFVVPAEEIDGEGSGIVDGAETIREAGAVFQGTELAFRIRIVIRDVGTAVRFRDPQIAEQESKGLGGHRRTAIGMDGELAASNALLAAGIFKELFGEWSAFAIGDHPADHIAAKDVEDDIQVEVSPFSRAQEFGDIPTPELIGAGGQQLGSLISG